MNIIYLGHSSFLIKTKTASVILDPFNKDIVGFNFPNVSADIVTISHNHDDHSASKNVSGEPIVISLPGEYEIKQVRIYGFPTYHDTNKGADRGKNTIYKFEAEDMSFLHCGDLGHVLSDELVEEIDGVDIIFVPVGGIYTIGPKEASQIIKALEPTIIIPMHYQQKGLNEKTFKELAPVEEFLTIMDEKPSEKVKKLSINKADLSEETKIIVMEK